MHLMPGPWAGLGILEHAPDTGYPWQGWVFWSMYLMQGSLAGSGILEHVPDAGSPGKVGYSGACTRHRVPWQGWAFWSMHQAQGPLAGLGILEHASDAGCCSATVQLITCKLFTN
ncbi:hypothetical protein OTU49_002042 [Cherax quadricarinatus]|uniref:Uncharacterized protein n=1 Tax=Cherax quadricarinatus TaxID=27406 RepID=A0AAW0XNL1_CHEQU